MTTMPIPLEAGRAMCSDPEHLPLVDAAADKPGGPEAQTMKDTLCRHCLVADLCHAWAMTHPEVGIWAGTGPKTRTRHGAPSAAASLTPLHRQRPAAPTTTPSAPKLRKRAPNVTETRLAELGVKACEVKRWAYERGLVRTIKGRVSMATVEAYASAHH